MIVGCLSCFVLNYNLKKLLRGWLHEILRISWGLKGPRFDSCCRWMWHHILLRSSSVHTPTTLSKFIHIPKNMPSHVTWSACRRFQDCGITLVRWHVQNKLILVIKYFKNWRENEIKYWHLFYQNLAPMCELNQI